MHTGRSPRVLRGCGLLLPDLAALVSIRPPPSMAGKDLLGRSTVHVNLAQAIDCSCELVIAAITVMKPRGGGMQPDTRAKARDACKGARSTDHSTRRSPRAVVLLRAIASRRSRISNVRMLGGHPLQAVQGELNEYRWTLRDGQSPHFVLVDTEHRHGAVERVHRQACA